MARAATSDQSFERAADRGELAVRHLRFGWASLFVFATLGVGLELLHGFKVGLYLDVGNETRRLLWTLAHAHGVLLPGGFFLGGAYTFSGDPGPGVLLTPLGAGSLLAALYLVTRAAFRE